MTVMEHAKDGSD